MDEETQLTAAQMMAVTALAHGRTRIEAASEAQVGERTVYRWLDDPTFAAAVREASDSLWTAVLAGLRCEGLEAVRRLAAVVRGKEAGTRLQVEAAKALLSATLRLGMWQEFQQLESRIAKLEARDAGS